jgi:plastocyanin
VNVGRANLVALRRMQGRRARRGILGLAAVATIALGAGQALGASEPIVAPPQPSCPTTSCIFSKPSFTIDQGTVATFQNMDTVNAHNVSGPGFGTPQIVAPGASAAVQGTQFLTPGTYPFRCTLHTGMVANLVVTASGTPVARPKVKLKILSKKLGKVVSSRRLKVKVTAVTASEDVSLSAKKGAKKLGSKGNINLAEGASRTVSLKLSASGRKALEGLKSAKVKVTAKVPHGSTASATRRLR